LLDPTGERSALHRKAVPEIFDLGAEVELTGMQAVELLSNHPESLFKGKDFLFWTRPWL
jgi:hypothetical protein